MVCAIATAKSLAEKITIDSNRCISEKIDDTTILVLSPDYYSEPQWFLISEWSLKHLTHPPQTLHDIISLKASPDKRFLAVISVGEGHPVLSVYKLADILANKKATLAFEIDPYPGFINIVGWQKTKLHIQSDMLLTHREKDGGRVPLVLALISTESFWLDVDTGTIIPISKELKKPAVYYGQKLLDMPADGYEFVQVLEAITYLNDSKALPYLKQAQTLKKYKKHHKEISEVLKKLEKSFQE